MLDLCSLLQPNAGAPECDKSRGIPRYLVIGNAAFLAANVASSATFKAAFKSACLKGRDESGKLIVLPIVMNVENQTEGNQEGTLNQGFKEVLREGAPAFLFGVRISNKHAQNLRALNKQEVKVFTVDDARLMWGTLTGTPSFEGEKAILFVGGDNFTDGQSSKMIAIGVSFTDVEGFKGSSVYQPIDFNVSDFGRLKDVYITEAAASAANVFKLTGKIKTGQFNKTLDVYADYAATMAAVNKWKAKNVATGAAFTITSVAVNAAGYWTVTLDTTAWTALTAGDQVEINFETPSVLDAAGVTGIEGVSLIVTKP